MKPLYFLDAPDVKPQSPLLKMSSPTKEDGFTLVEVLIALVIFVIAAVTLNSLMSDRITRYNTNVDLTLKAWIASNQLVESQVYGAENKSETIEFANAEWETSREVTPTENENLSRITIEVTKINEPNSTKKQSTFKLVSLVPNGGSE